MGQKHLGKKIDYSICFDEEQERIIFLDSFPNRFLGENFKVLMCSNEFTSLCPMTGQPDFGTIEIEYIPNEICLESKGLKMYLFSFRNKGMFMEQIVNVIFNDLSEFLKPKWMKVRGIFNLRGGIGITVEKEKEYES